LGGPGTRLGGNTFEYRRGWVQAKQRGFGGALGGVSKKTLTRTVIVVAM